MKKKYELWLDESGSFKNEGRLKQQKKNPSLVGGILIEKHEAERADLSQFIGSVDNHAMLFTDEMKRRISLPALEGIKKQYRAREVFFENRAYQDEATNRQLYLKIIAEGLLQLLQTLNAEHESIQLEVYIAQRQDVEAVEPSQSRIAEKEYKSALLECIRRKKRMRRILLDENSELQFIIQPAARQKKLQMADFACNTRLTRDSNAFASCQERLAALYEDALIFSMSEIGSENDIKRSLSQGYLSDAVMELYTTIDILPGRQELLDLILLRMQNTNYRILKSQLKQCSSDIIAYAALQDDYEVGEMVLERINSELISRMEAKGIPCMNFQYTLLLWLSDEYLREGDIVAARKTVEQCELVQKKMGNSLEELLPYYQVIEKKSLLYINEFNFQSAKELLESTGELFSSLMKVVTECKSTMNRFPDIKSEYYGDLLCMEIYAMMFMQREHPETYENLCRLSDLAMKQYPEREGELERHRQYRSRIEAEHGNYEKALHTLFEAGEFFHEECGKKDILEFLNKICRTEQNISLQYYLMYYLLILCEAKLHNHPLGDMMYEVLIEQKHLMEYGNINQAEMSIFDDMDIQAVRETESGIEYHPMEVIAWKYATYLMLGKKYQTAERFYRKGISICFAHENYTVLQITGLGIWSELLYCQLLGENSKEAKIGYKRLMKQIEKLKHKKLQPETIHFIQRMETQLKDVIVPGSPMNKDALWQAARMITY